MNFKRHHESKNLFDVSSAVFGSVIGQHGATTYGSVVVSTVTLASDYIYVNPTKQYVFSCENYDPANPNGRGYAFYDSNKNVISSDIDTIYVLQENVSLNLTPPINANYVRISYDKNATKLMLNEGSTALPYEPYSSEVWHDIPHYIYNAESETWQEISNVHERSSSQWD